MTAKIIIVDDEESICFGFEMILSGQGYDVKTAVDYDSALNIIVENEPDLILTDILLGGHTGVDLLQEVKKRGLVCPVIMMTGEPNIQTAADAVRLGAFDYIAKPIRRETLLRITANSLRYKELQDEKLKLERENLKSRLNMEAIFRSLKDGIVSVSTDLTVIEANTAVEKICGISALGMIGTNFADIDSGCSKACIDVLKNTLETGKTVTDVQVECKGKYDRMLLVTASPLKSKTAENFGAVVVMRDVTRITNLEHELKERHQFHRMIGKSRQMQKIYSLLDNLAETDSTVLVTGETGTGKELIADAVHYNGSRKDGPFIKVNCSALSENLLESELFGHIKGAFTGAISDKKGRFELADTGTIFLDEIGDISPLIQLKLLRVLQEKEFERVGDSRTIKTDVRVVVATNCDLKEKVRKGEFREDLYYRIKVMEVLLPSLIDRREDIPLLAEHFSTLFNKRFKKQISTLSNEVINAFMNYCWPGNIRELEHAIEHGYILCSGEILMFDHLPAEIKDFFGPKIPARSGRANDTKEDILKALEKTGWNKSKAARLLGMGRRTIYRKIEEFKINLPPE